MNTQTAEANYIRVTPRKMRLIANTLKGLSLSEAEAQLMVRSQRARLPLLKLIRSAAANAIHNKQMNKENLFIFSLIINEGPMLKRGLPRSQGRMDPIHKKMSHATVTLAEREGGISRFIITPPPKKEKKSTVKDTRRIKSELAQGEDTVKTKKGVFRKMFQRKAMDGGG